MTGPVLAVDGLHVVYHTRERVLPALTDVSLEIKPGEVLGIVGESGCGKSTLSSALLRLLPPNGEVTGGRVIFNGADLLAANAETMRRVRGGQLAMIFQDPLTSLNPVFTIGTQIVDAQAAHTGKGRDRRVLRRLAIETLEQVGIPDAADRIDNYPHQFSGGMRQRIMIAMALLLEPVLLIADEATSALDVTLEAQILELLDQLRINRGTAIMFISHDLGVVAHLCDRVAVMYAGRMVEEGDVLAIYEKPLHPYTQALLAAVPSRTSRGQRLATIAGRVPDLSALPHGCKFAERCEYAQRVCQEDEPDYVNVALRRVRCDMHDMRSGYDRAALPEAVRMDAAS
jgi:peptide/nickel transport system ATP-binding protein